MHLRCVFENDQRVLFFFYFDRSYNTHCRFDADERIMHVVIDWSSGFLHHSQGTTCAPLPESCSANQHVSQSLSVWRYWISHISSTYTTSLSIHAHNYNWVFEIRQIAHVKSYSVTDICLYSTSEELSRCSAETFTFTFTFLIPGWGSFPEQPTIRTSVRIISILRSTALQAAHHGEVHKRSERHHSAHSLDDVMLMQMIFVKFFL